MSAPRPHRRLHGAILWFTGLSGSGKSTLAAAIAGRLTPLGRVEVLDGDDVRRHLSPELGFAREDRDVNVRRIGFVARLLARHGIFVVSAIISPYAEVRQEMRTLAGDEEIPFLEVFTNASLEALIRRDVKGLYRRALAGEIPHFTGISDPYEAPVSPDVVVYTDRQSIDASAHTILRALVDRGLVDPEAIPIGAGGEPEGSHYGRSC